MKFKSVLLVAAAVGGAATCSAKGGFFRSLVNQTVDAIVAPPPPPPPPPPAEVVVQQPVYVQPAAVIQPVVQQPVYVQQQTVAQQPVVQQPAAVQPAVVEAPAEQAAVQQPAAAATAVAQVANAAPAAVDPSAFANARTTSGDTAVPEFKYGAMTFKKPATPEQIAEAKAQVKNVGSTVLRFVDGVDDATIAAAIYQMPDVREVKIDGKRGGVTTLAPLALLKNAKTLDINNVDVSDLSPLAGLPKVERLLLRYCKLQDLSPVATLPNVKDVDCYGATVTSFAPLAALPKLEKVCYYAVKGDQSTFDTLGALKQVKKFHGGLTKMTSLEWCRNVPQMEELQVFAEKIDDFSPISALPNLKYFRSWKMKTTGTPDLSFLANCKKLERLELPGNVYANLAVIGTLTTLTQVDVSDWPGTVDLSFVKSLPNLDTLVVTGGRQSGEVQNFEALAGHPALKNVALRNAKGVKSLECLKTCPKLKSVTVKKGAFSDEEIAALTAAMKAQNKYSKVSAY